MQEAAGDRRIRAGWRVHQKADEATRRDDSRGARLSVGRGLQNRQRRIRNSRGHGQRAADLCAFPNYAGAMRRGAGVWKANHRRRRAPRSAIPAHVSHDALRDRRPDEK